MAGDRLLSRSAQRVGEREQIAALRGGVHERAAQPRHAAQLNEDLTKQGAYNKLQKQFVTTWLNIRNDAAHKHYENYTPEQVASMLQGVREFIARYPA